MQAERLRTKHVRIENLQVKQQTKEGSKLDFFSFFKILILYDHEKGEEEEEKYKKKTTASFLTQMKPTRIHLMLHNLCISVHREVRCH